MARRNAEFEFHLRGVFSPLDWMRQFRVMLIEKNSKTDAREDSGGWKLGR